MHIFLAIVLCTIAILWIAESVEIASGSALDPLARRCSAAERFRVPASLDPIRWTRRSRQAPRRACNFFSLGLSPLRSDCRDDRSKDGTGAILETAAQTDARLKPVHVALPDGWLGKPHALQQAYERSSGEWLVFTDADVHFRPDLLRRSIALAQTKNWDHMTLLGAPKMFTPSEKIVMTFFGLAFVIGTRPWSASNRDSAGYNGVGAFQLIRRRAYEQIGTHRRLAMEVIDDMKLGKLVKESGLHSSVAKAGDSVSVHWHAGLRNTIRGTTKNFFAASGYKLWLVSAQILGLLLMCVFPVAALPFVHGWARLFAAIAAGVPLIMAGGVAIVFNVSPIYALTYPIGALIFAWMLARSTIVTLWQGGIVWRGTFYPLDELKRGVV